MPAPDEPAAEDTPESRFIPLETRSIVPGGYRAPGRKRLWIRELCPLVKSEPWTPQAGVAAVADLTNALAHTDEQPNHCINADVTLYLGRLPKGEWIGLGVAGQVGADGVSIASCDLYDTTGRCGATTVAAPVAPAPLDIPT